MPQEETHPTESNNQERFFYHSFPRPDNGDGLKILDSICRNGLLMTPERRTWEDPTHPIKGVQNVITQQRLCFTEISPSDLPAHSKQFGEFALEYDSHVIRGIGAMPVMYVPNFTELQRETYHIAGFSLIADLLSAVDMMNSLKDNVISAPNTSNLFSATNQKGESEWFTRSLSEQIVINQFLEQQETTVGKRFDRIKNSLETLASLWYPTDYKDKKLHYFRQREWRVIWHRHLPRPTFIEDLSDDQELELLKMNNSFFGQLLKPELPNDKPLYRRCLYVKLVNGNHVLCYANRLWVPGKFARESEAILKRHGFDIPVVPISGDS